MIITYIYIHINFPFCSQITKKNQNMLRETTITKPSLFIIIFSGRIYPIYIQSGASISNPAILRGRIIEKSHAISIPFLVNYNEVILKFREINYKNPLCLKIKYHVFFLKIASLKFKNTSLYN